MPRAITAEERYLFDVHGFLVVPNAIDAPTLCAINAIVDGTMPRRTKERRLASARSPPTRGEAMRRRR